VRAHGDKLRLGITAAAHARNGALDWLDPCSKPEAQLASETQDWEAAKSTAAAAFPSATPTAEFVAKWWDLQKEIQRKKFFEEHKEFLAKLGLDKDAAFEAWFAEQRAKVDPKQVSELIGALPKTAERRHGSCKTYARGRYYLQRRPCRCSSIAKAPSRMR
jgi:hypothetical protein